MKRGSSTLVVKSETFDLNSPLVHLTKISAEQNCGDVFPVGPNGGRKGKDIWLGDCNKRRP